MVLIEKVLLFETYLCINHRLHIPPRRKPAALSIPTRPGLCVEFVGLISRSDEKPKVAEHCFGGSIPYYQEFFLVVDGKYSVVVEIKGKVRISTGPENTV